MERIQSGSSALPPKALERREALRKARAIRDQRELGNLVDEEKGRRSGVLAEIRRKDEEAKGVLEKMWLGGEGEDWKKKRDEREKEALEDGRGYGGLIMDQIWEVWSWGKDKNEEIREKDEEVLEERSKVAEARKK